jgi:hypothetical protein
MASSMQSLGGFHQWIDFALDITLGFLLCMGCWNSVHEFIIIQRGPAFVLQPSPKWAFIR